ncbi:MAG: cytochrome P450 [Pirellulaceae bacterium]|nr:cytochrome P450 [Pirellulaceae bacterium]
MARKYPPGPTNFNAGFGLTWRHAWLQCADPLGFSTRLARKYGDIVFYRLFIHEAFQINHPDLIREVLVTKAASFQKQARQRELIRRTTGDGILTTDGPAWVRQRRMMLPAFNAGSGQRLAQIGVEEAQRTVAGWHSGREFALYREMTSLMVRAVGRAFFGIDDAGESLQIADALQTLADAYLDLDYFLVRLPAWIPTARQRRIRAAEQFLDQYFDRAIRDRAERAHGQRDLLALLLDAVDETGDGQRMSPAQLRGEARTMFFAGYHTAAANLTWTLYLLATHAEIRRRVAEEIDAVLGSRTPTMPDLPRLGYIEQVIKESMRLYPPAWVLFAREAIEDVEVGGYLLPRGAWVFIYPWVMHRDERFFPDPLKFDPDRFLPDREAKLPTGAYIPLGLGAHNCIGGRIAMLALQLVLPTLLQRHELSLAPGQSPPQPKTSISLRPKIDLQMIPRELAPSSATEHRS